MSKHLLVELGCEELPPKALNAFSDSFYESFHQGFKDANLSFSALKVFATPRRLAITVADLAEKQPDQIIEKLGPAIKIAFDKDGKPTKAALGFARSNGVEFSDLSQKETDKGPRLLYSAVSKGLPTTELIGPVFEQAIKALPIPKRMRWGNHRFEFSRPVHWLTCLYGKQVIDLTLFGQRSGNLSYGHRFHAPDAFTPTAETYQSCLLERYVIADFSQRRDSIIEQLNKQAATVNAVLHIDPELLDEVTALVEWPVALIGGFDAEFLKIPPEVLISSMKSHQKYFHLLDTHGQLLPFFITVANIDSNDPAIIINGNERVIRPRLSDAAFFFESDKKIRLETRTDKLRDVTFQDKLGSLFDKTQRLQKLSAHIAQSMKADTALAERAALLCKADLVTDMVIEFPDLQGVMGHYYAINDNEQKAVSDAIIGHYLPKSADDELPATSIGQALSLADKIDTLIGIFAIGQQPTGNKDPFALRRSSLGILKIIIEKQIDVDLVDIFTKSAELYQDTLGPVTIQDPLTYSFDRLKAYYQAKGIRTEVYLAVADTGVTHPLDFDRRIKSVQAFDTREEALSLSAANKRVNNLLTKNAHLVGGSVDINSLLLQDKAEKELVSAIESLDTDYQAALSKHDYTTVLSLLANLREPVDNFFDQVMIMADDNDLKLNRLQILLKLHQLFSSIANISLLAKS